MERDTLTMEPQHQAERVEGRLPRILVVEDEPEIAGFIRRGLIYKGYDVDVAPSTTVVTVRPGRSYV